MCSDFPVLRDLAMTCYGSASGNVGGRPTGHVGGFTPTFAPGHWTSDYTPFDSADGLPVTANLESLIIRGGEKVLDRPVLDYLTLPRLRRLELRHRPQFQALASFRIRSACILEHLAIELLASTCAEFYELIHLFPDFSGIISLDLDTYTHLDSLIFSLQDPTLLLHLTSLCLNSWCDGIDYETLTWCLRLRNRDRNVLKSFTLGFDNPQVAELAGLPTDRLILAELESIVADGIEVRICSSEGEWPLETRRTFGRSRRKISVKSGTSVFGPRKFAYSSPKPVQPQQASWGKSGRGHLSKWKVKASGSQAKVRVLKPNQNISIQVVHLDKETDQKRFFALIGYLPQKFKCKLNGLTRMFATCHQQRARQVLACYLLAVRRDAKTE
ncbi:hypothetical protein B0H16DRAFT_1480494 [Mycena metata]|uniref:Uncharacterized protein n=1 Tax=Mycena metata TaxID=1033252 RepID=A0AAD7MCV9_9AGAR|nr:hypothetical protein B0H16DRAFT_1480494 [Mycena metata]